jgi:hypothetical protein
MKPTELINRRKFDFRILTDMRSPIFDFRAYRASADLRADRRRITSESDAGAASKYAMTLRVPTMAGPGKMSRETVFGVDTDVADYPLTEPQT